MAVLTFSMAALISILAQSTLYGLYLVLFIGSLCVTYTKQSRGDRKGINVFLFTMNIILFLLTTAHWLIQILRILDAFVLIVDESYYGNMTNPKYAAKTAALVGQTIVADSTMVYRLYIVWGKSWRMIVLPSILIIGLLGSGIGLTELFARLRPGDDVLALEKRFLGLINTFNGATLILNLVISGLISYRIWAMNCNVAGLTGNRRVNSIIYVLLEGAFLYVGCLVAIMVGYLTGGAYQTIPLDAASPMIGIAFCMIIVWVGLGMGIEHQSVLSDIECRPSHAITLRKTDPSEVKIGSTI